MNPYISLFVGVTVYVTVRPTDPADPTSPRDGVVTLDALVNTDTEVDVTPALNTFTYISPGVYQMRVETSGLAPGRYVYRARLVNSDGTALHEGEFSLLAPTSLVPTFPSDPATPDPAQLDSATIAVDQATIVFVLTPPFTGPSPDHYVLYAQHEDLPAQLTTVGASPTGTLAGDFTHGPYDCWVVAVAARVTSVESNHVSAVQAGP